MPIVRDIERIDPSEFNKINAELVAHTTQKDELSRSVHSVVKNWMDNDPEHVFVRDLQLPNEPDSNKARCRAMYLCTAKMYINNAKPILKDLWFTKTNKYENGLILWTNPDDTHVTFMMDYNSGHLPDSVRGMKLDMYYDLILNPVKYPG